jgi:hypothetical protein
MQGIFDADRRANGESVRGRICSPGPSARVDRHLADHASAASKRATC